jgi:transcriptional repressor NrdR
MTIACVKREINMDEIERMIDKLELQWSSESELLTTRIGQDIMAYLKDLDFVAFIRFASVYQHFD